MTGFLKASILAVFLSGCAALNSEPWPKAGAGGMAEMAPPADDVAGALRARMESARARGAEQFAALDFAHSQSLLNRLERERSGQLDLDADADAARLNGLMANIERFLPPTRRAMGGSGAR